MKVYDGSRLSRTEEASPERCKVGIAEYEVTTDGAVLTTSGLGSCIGVALYDPGTGAAGLVHVMLPVADGDVANPAKYADTGVELLLEEMAASGADLDRVTAKLAGGSDMLDFSENGESIGSRNVTQVRATLSERDVPVVGEDVGGDHGRSLRLEASTGDLVVKSANQDTTRL